jgi:hypothetical protein
VIEPVALLGVGCVEGAHRQLLAIKGQLGPAPCPLAKNMHLRIGKRCGERWAQRRQSSHWGGYLAKHGYAVFAIDYRLMKPGINIWPGMVGDCRAAVQFGRAEAEKLGLDSDRIGTIGDSAGAHPSAPVLTGDEPLFSSQYPNDPCSTTSANVKAVIGFYGVYDMVAQWEHNQITRPRAISVTEKLPGCSAGHSLRRRR